MFIYFIKKDMDGAAGNINDTIKAIKCQALNGWK